MKNLITNILLVILTALPALSMPRNSSQLPHMDPEMTSAEYRKLLAKIPATFDIADVVDPETPALNAWIAIGDRMNKWVDLINSRREVSAKISLSSPGTQGGHSPLEASIYNFAIIQGQWRAIQILLPTPLNSVIFGGGNLPEQNPMSDRDFIDWMSQIDHAYQSAARYKMMKPYIQELRMRAVDDVRGYLRLIADNDLNTKLANWDGLSNLQRDQLSKDLVSNCLNSYAVSATCFSELNAAITAKTLTLYKDKYLPLAKKHYEAYFQIEATRKDVTWTAANPNALTIPFTNPHNQAVLDYLKLNIEDEWKWNGWQLALNFVETSDPDTTHVEFQPGVTPHVNGIAGSIITMDQNQLLTEYNVKWTIRHEFGHVMGFVDCYLEFYDDSVQAIVSYQLDVTNLMCSRRGHFQQIHFDELKKNYLTP